MADAGTRNSTDFRSIGRNVTIYPWVRITNPETMSIGSNVIIDDFCFIGRHKRIDLGSFVHIAVGSVMVGGGEFVMEDFSSITHTSVYTGSEDASGACLTNPTVPAPFREPKRSFVHVGRYAFVGAHCVIMPGVTIGEGAVIGAGSVVTKDCEPWTVYVGTPARPIKTRPKDGILAQERALLLTMEQTRSTSDSGNEP